jgi:hypothetical protein
MSHKGIANFIGSEPKIIIIRFSLLFLGIAIFYGIGEARFGKTFQP